MVRQCWVLNQLQNFNENHRMNIKMIKVGLGSQQDRKHMWPV